MKEWRDISPTVRCFEQNASKLQLSYQAVKRGLDKAQRSSFDARLKFLKYLKAINSLPGRHTAQQVSLGPGASARLLCEQGLTLI